ncbi:tripartite tricarboxylate transporter permease [Devosia sp. YIM 151766]|uniref:tripartite tricarboxylate transporter permease n=1 Tax=Devosia sp. YIM 151766 TaxID=3017325 RepID=UPI00255CF465|nr:tripartite tricarboxylate transporter permease [Devosia sp. YIM 151766]WIY53218.1 tripartite tricarboxylate transporter permease [Devosia sp. YIM 151766]
MTALLDGMLAVFEPTVIMCLGAGVVVGMLVGMFPGITATMAVALASSFTMTLEPVQGLAVLLTIYVAANFGDRIPSILINTPGTPASIATTFDGYPMAKNGQAGLALIVSALVSAIGIVASMALFAFASVPLAQLALKFGPSEMFAVVILAMTIMISISSKSIAKGLLAGIIGLFIATVGRDPITGDARFTFGVRDLNSGLDFIAVIIGLFGIAELFDQILTHRAFKIKPISALGRWWPTKSEYKRIAKPTFIAGIVGLVVGIIPGAGGDIAGLLGWDRAKAASKTKESFGKGNIEGIAASDTASSATLGGSLTTTMALGIPGDSVMAVMIGSMIVWGIQPGPSLFVNQPSLVVTITTIMLLATFVTLAINLVRMPMMVRLLDMPIHYIWATVLVFCLVGTYATTNNMFTVGIMLAFGVIGVVFKRCGIPASPIVLGLILGPLAESNLRRSLLIDGPAGLVNKPISATLLTFAFIAIIVALATPLLQRRRAKVAGLSS